MDIAKIQEKYKNKGYDVPYDAQATRLLPKGHVFDENASVKKNAEMVEEHNSKAKLLKQEYYKAVAEKQNELRADVRTYLKETYGFKDILAKYVEGLAWENGHSMMGDYFQKVDEFAEICETAIDLAGKE